MPPENSSQVLLVFASHLIEQDRFSASLLHSPVAQALLVTSSDFKWILSLLLVGCFTKFHLALLVISYYALEKVYKNKNNIIYILFSLHMDMLGLYYDSSTSGHLGYSWTTFTLHQHYWWPGATKDIKNYMDHYQVCLLMKGLSKPLARKLIPLPIPTKPWSSIFMLI